MAQVVISDRLPLCSRCRGALLTSIVMPQNDEHGRPIHLELCAACDSDRPAAGTVSRFFVNGHGRDTARAKQGALLVMEWTKEGMAAHGWFWEQKPSLPD
ncbi:DUF6300 family protein [Streptomyces sp. NBC_00342]|uniref:DUF6300 family protein n=1 Tax=Streptomyces sp. NBC_00342 TaxID=2975718 RepID=UPI002E2BD66B|nr:DUF6300 family protein [Streptomyces sp. NBC_00342]